MTSGRAPTTRLARPIDLGTARHATHAALAARLHPRYAGPVRRVDTGRVTYRGLPFDLGPSEDRRWLLVDREIDVDCGGVHASWLVLLAFCDAWRDERGERPTGTPLGWVLPVGEPLATLTITSPGTAPHEVVLRRRFEVNEGVIGWGNGAFLALPHRMELPIDPLGPHPRQEPGRYAPVGHAGPMTILPGGWGARQPGVEDHVPSATDDIMLWLHAIDLRLDGRPTRVDRVRLAPLSGPGTGRDVVVAALTAFSGKGSPLRWRPRTSFRVEGATGTTIDVDLGIVGRRRPLPGPVVPGLGDPGLPGPAGEDGRTPAEPALAEELEVAAAEDAELVVGDQRVPLWAGSAAGARPSGIVIEALPPADRRVRVELVGPDGARLAGRVAFRARDGRVLPPLGHADTVNVGLYEDVGADLQLGGSTWAYVDGSFDIDLPADGAVAEVMAGPDRPGVRLDLGAEDLGGGPLRVTLGPAVTPREGDWVSGDTHVHFLAPTTALVQARAEGVNVVHLLATQWGDLVTSLLDREGDQRHPDGRHVVWMGSENRQNMLGHIGLVGGGPHLPFASGGAPEGRIGDAVRVSMADWLRRCREEGGLAIGAHFPLPMTEVAADIAMGLLDALEVQVFDPTLESPPIREWYRYLDAGYRLPLVGGTDRMSAEVPLGQVRTWARLDPGAELTFEAWASAVRAGRTFVTSGPILELRVDGRGPGETIEVGAGGHVEVELVARAARPIVSAVEVVLDGRVVSACLPAEPGSEVALRERIPIDRSGWLAGRSRSPHAWPSAFATSMAAHTSPVWIEVPGRPRPAADLDLPLALVDGTRAWLETLAPIADERDLARFRDQLAEAERRLRSR